MRVLNTADFTATLPKLLKFEAQSFGDYPYTPAPERLTHWWETGNFFLGGTENDAGELQALFTVLMTTQEEYEKFRTHQIPSSKQMAPHPGKPEVPVVMYIPTLIVGDRYWMPVIFKSLLRDLDATMEKRRLHADFVFATALDKRSIFLMKKQGFQEAGLYKDGYKILTANHNQCAIFRNFVR